MNAFLNGAILKELILSELILQKIERFNTGNTSRYNRHLNRQIYGIIRHEILSGTLKPGTKLPASRTLAKEIGVSRNTVMFAYEQLLAEGYVGAQSGSGTFVQAISLQNKHIHRSSVKTKNSPADFSTVSHKTGAALLSQRGRNLLAHASASEQQWGAFISGVPDVRLFPHQIWRKLLNKVWRDPSPALLTYAHHGGYLPLKKALAEHLGIFRSVSCQPEQIILISGIHQGIDLVSRLLADAGDKAWMEDPGYWGIRNVLESNGLEVIPLPVDNEGILPDPVQMAQPPRLITVTPSHQYPLGMTMSLQRRTLLLEYARQHEVWIIEDDYDSEFRFQGQPLSSLQGLDQNARVIYMGTFSKTLFPGMRMSFMVLPRTLASPFASAQSELFREGQLLQQAVLAEFIEEGHYATHIRRMRQCYARRLALLKQCIAERLSADWPLSSDNAGLHLVLHLPPDTDDQGICAAARNRGLIIRPLSCYYAQTQSARKGLILGYACVDEVSMAPAFERLFEIIVPALKTPLTYGVVPQRHQTIQPSI